MAVHIDYDQIAAAYAQHRRVHPEVLRCLIDELTSMARVLEVGCGTGNYLGAIHELLGCSCCGIDPSAEMLSQAARSHRVELFQGTAEALPFESAHFDFVFSVDVIHHLRGRERFLGEAWRVLKAGGRICTVTDSEAVIRCRQPFAEYFPETVEIDLARYPQVSYLKNTMRDVGFVGQREVEVEFAFDLSDIGPFRDRAFSCLQLIPDEIFQQELSRLENDLLTGPIPCVSRYTLLWATKPPSAK